MELHYSASRIMLHLFLNRRKVEMSPYWPHLANAGPAIRSYSESIQHRGLGLSRPPALAPQGSLAGWPRCWTISLERMAGFCWENRRQGQLVIKGDISTLLPQAAFRADDCRRGNLRQKGNISTLPSQT